MEKAPDAFDVYDGEALASDVNLETEARVAEMQAEVQERLSRYAESLESSNMSTEPKEGKLSLVEMAQNILSSFFSNGPDGVMRAGGLALAAPMFADILCRVFMQMDLRPDVISHNANSAMMGATIIAGSMIIKEDEGVESE